MKLARLETVTCDAGWRPWLFVKATTDDGLVGWSEVTDSHGSPTGLAGVVADLAPLVAGKDPRAWVDDVPWREELTTAVPEIVGGEPGFLVARAGAWSSTRTCSSPIPGSRDDRAFARRGRRALDGRRRADLQRLGADAGCLEHFDASRLAHAVVVADNASTDGTPDRVRESFPEAGVVELTTNQGFAVACNRGARAGAGDVVVLLNNDVECPPDFLARIVAPLAAADRLGSVAAVLVRPDGGEIDSAGLTADRTFAGFPRLRGFSPEDASASAPVLSGPAGAAGAYRRAAWDEVGGLDEGVFMYGEDIDLAFRLRAAGWGTVLAADAVAVHVGSASIHHRSSWQNYHGGFARGYFLRRYGVLRSAAAVRALATETIVVAGDAVLSRDLAATRGRVAGWRAAARLPRATPPSDAVDREISFGDSLRLRRRIYAT